MHADTLIDVLSLLSRGTGLNGSDRFTPFVLEFLGKLRAEYPGFPQLRAAIELDFPSSPFLRAATATRAAVPDHDPDEVVQGFVTRVIGMGAYEASHPNGIVNRHFGDFHISLREHPFPVSLAFGEMKFFRRLLAGLRKPEVLTVLEIGTGFGVSSAFLAYCAAADGQPCAVTTIDPFVEDRDSDHSTVLAPGYDAAAVDYSRNLSYNSFQALRREFPESAVEQVLDFSPRCFARPDLADRRFDLVFIDGNHFDDQPSEDFFGCLPLTHPGTVFALHDSHAPGVERLLVRLRAGPWTVTTHASSCNLSVVTRAADAAHPAG